MNVWYSLMESPHRWPYMAAISFGAGCVGTMMMIAYNWPAMVARAWFYAALIATIYCLVRAFLEWKNPPDSGHIAGHPARDRPPPGVPR